MRIFLAALVIAAAAPDAEAAFTVCNKTQHGATVALGRFDGTAWISEGWFEVGPGACQTILEGDLIARYYYLHAVHLEVGGGWDGDRGFCVSEGTFRITGRNACEDRGYDRKGFFEIDTGQSADWTQTLAD